MKFKFGVQEKTTLLVLVLVGLTAYLGPRLLIGAAKKILEQHELVDLADESEIQAWKLYNQIVNLDTIVRKNASTPKRIAAFVEDLKAQQAAEQAGESGAPLPDGDAGTTNELESFIQMLRYPSEDPTAVAPEILFSRSREIVIPEQEEFLTALAAAPRSEAYLSRIHRVDISPTSHPHWAPVISVGTFSEKDNAFIVITYNLERARSSRHLFLLTDAKGEKFLEHPDRNADQDFSHSRFFGEVSGTEEFQHKPERNETISITRYDGLFELKDPKQFGEPYIIAEGDANEEIVRYFDGHPVMHREFFRRLSSTLADAGAAVGGLKPPQSGIRLLAPSRESFEQFRKLVETELAAAFPDQFDHIDWRPEVICDRVDIALSDIRIQTVFGVEHYTQMFNGFRNELSSNLDNEMRDIWGKVAIPSLGAGLIAFVASLFFVRPLQKITATAQSVADTRHEDLREKIENMTKSLPVSRRDEIGEIARALKRLFNEVQASHRELDNRVRERTRELEDANEKLQGLAREKDSFLANVSHELRNPLNVVDGYLQFLETSDLDDEQRDDVRKSRRAAKALLELINDILDYQKITMRGITLEPTEVELDNFLEEIKDTMEIHAAKNNNRIIMDAPEGLGAIETDAKRLRQIIVNLMGNASKFTKDGTVTLETRRKTENGGDWVEFRVKDTGRGMTEEEQSKIFTVFYTNKKANESGTGLGLAISRELCRMMNGHVGLESSVLGEGTTFLIRIPSRQGDTSLAGPETVPGIPPGSHSILVIDDDPDVREIMRRHLEGQGYKVLCAADGKEGIERAREEQPDAITLDAVMPDIDGWEVLSTLKSDPATSGIPVLMVTILNKEAKGFALGADDYLVKPVDWNRFSQVLGNLTSLGKHNTILVVDDEEVTRSLFRRVLAKDGWRVLEAEHGAEALHILGETRPDLIILDLMMPVMDGFEFLTEFRRHPGWENIPVIVVTAKTLTDDERRILGLSVSRVLEKGAISHEDLLETIQRRVGPGASGKPKTDR